MDDAYKVSPFERPKTPVLTGPSGAKLACPVCGNRDQDKMLTITDLAGNTLLGAVCAVCEDRVKRS